MTAKFAIVPEAAITDKRLTAMHLRVLALVSYYGGNKPNGCWPSYQTIAEKLATNRRAIIKYINHLCELKYIIKEVRYRENGSSTTNILRVDMDIIIGAEESAISEHPAVLKKITSPSAQKDHPHKEPYNSEPYKENNKRKKAPLLALEDWEVSNGLLNAEMIKAWCIDNKLTREVINKLIAEFRIAVMSREKQYANFKLAFQNYLVKGWLSKTLEQAQAMSKATATTIVNNRGVNL